MTERIDLSDEPIHWELGSSLSYGEYLQLDKVLDLGKMTKPGLEGPGGGG